MEEKIKKMIQESIDVKSKVLDSSQQIANIAEKIIKSLKSGRCIFTCGNGGSTDDAMHFAEELVGRYKRNRPALKALALTDASTITCIANDFGYDYIFQRQIEAHGKKGDVLIGLSTSGNSKNVINAIKKAKELGILTIGFLGKGGGELKKICDLSIVIPSNESSRIQESHITIIHSLCECIEDNIFPE